MQQGVRSKNHPPRPPFLPRHYITCRLWIFSRKANGGGPDHRGCCSHKPRLFATPTDGRFWKSVCRQGGAGKLPATWQEHRGMVRPPPLENLRPDENPSTDGFGHTVVSKRDGIWGAFRWGIHCPRACGTPTSRPVGRSFRPIWGICCPAAGRQQVLRRGSSRLTSSDQCGIDTVFGRFLPRRIAPAPGSELHRIADPVRAPIRFSDGLLRG